MLVVQGPVPVLEFMRFGSSASIPKHRCMFSNFSRSSSTQCISAIFRSGLSHPCISIPSRLSIIKMCNFNSCVCSGWAFFSFSLTSSCKTYFHHQARCNLKPIQCRFRHITLGSRIILDKSNPRPSRNQSHALESRISSVSTHTTPHQFIAFPWIVLLGRTNFLAVTYC